MNANTGDIVLFQFKNRARCLLFRPWAAIIDLLQGNPITHTAIVVNPQEDLIVEAYYPIVRKAVFQNVFSERCYKWHIVRPVKADVGVQRRAAKAARKLVGVRYDVRGVFKLAKWLMLERAIQSPVRPMVGNVRDSASKMFCQELVTSCYIEAGFDLTKYLGFEDPSAIVPADLDPFGPNRDKFLLIESSEFITE